MAVELSEWECDSAHQLYTNLLEASKDHAKSFLITDLQPNEIFFDIDACVPENGRCYELMYQVIKLNGLREQVARNAKGAMEFASDGRIFSDIEVINFVRENSLIFENSTLLSEACLLAQKAQKLTNEYVENARGRYAQFIESVLPRLEIINEALKKLTDNATGTENANRNMQIEAITQDMQSNIQRMDECKDEQTRDLKSDIEKMAMQLDSGYQEIYQELIALHQSSSVLTTLLVAPVNSPQVLPAVELKTSECSSAQKLFESLLKASEHQEKVGVITDWQPNEIVIHIDPDVQNALWNDLLKKIEELNEMRKQLVYSTLEAMKNVTTDTITSDADAITLVEEHLTDFENITLLATACLLVEKGQKLSDEYVKKVRVRYAQFIESALPKLDVINSSLKNLAGTSGDALNSGLLETIELMQSNIQQMKENEKRLMNSLLDDVEDMALHVDSGYDVIRNDLNVLCQN